MAEDSKQVTASVRMADIPEKISEYLCRHFNDDVVYGITNENLIYEVGVSHNGLSHLIKFDSDGNFISKSTELDTEGEMDSFEITGTVD